MTDPDPGSRSSESATTTSRSALTFADWLYDRGYNDCGYTREHWVREVAGLLEEWATAREAVDGRP